MASDLEQNYDDLSLRVAVERNGPYATVSSGKAREQRCCNFNLHFRRLCNA
jgi:hypothetical protein